MDRMDCQLLMVCFTYVHYDTFIIPRTTSVRAILAAIWLLPTEDQLLLFYQVHQRKGTNNYVIFSYDGLMCYY